RAVASGRGASSRPAASWWAMFHRTASTLVTKSEGSSMPTIAESRCWQPLLERYYRSPSIALCRVPEVELFSGIALRAPVLDHCGGDGFIASLAFPGRQLEACVDFDEARLARASSSRRYASVKWGDVGRSLPFEDGKFATVINNSGIEHVPDLPTALSEI